MSGGRVELGLGSGWFDSEHQAYGIPFPPVSERFDRLTEQLEIIDGLFGTPVGDTFNYDGKHYQLVDSPALPKPTQARLPIIVGGRGPKRTPALAARFATEFNTPFTTVADAATLFEQVRVACAQIGRTELPEFSSAAALCVGRDDAEVRRRAAVIGREVDELRTSGAAVGTVDEVVEILGQYRQAGASRMFLQTLDLDDLDQIELVASAVAPQLS
jgi:alkanesulfonate monooxygenase SsuD/methylene tetrahydromethanopterin reductase-like flavin-dependent oxidoreductase (luciferase family)